MKFFCLSFVIAIYSSQIMDHVANSNGQTTSGGHASSTENIEPIGRPIPFAASQPVFQAQPQAVPVFIQPISAQGGGPSINEGNTQTSANSGLVGITTSGSGSGLAGLSLLSNS
jgi:hypothetical protein